MLFSAPDPVVTVTRRRKRLKKLVASGGLSDGVFTASFQYVPARRGDFCSFRSHVCRTNVRRDLSCIKSTKIGRALMAGKASTRFIQLQNYRKIAYDDARVRAASEHGAECMYCYEYFCNAKKSKNYICKDCYSKSKVF